MGTQAQAVGLRRNYGGLLGRADRMVLLLAAPLLQLYWTWVARNGSSIRLAGQATSFLELLLVYFAVVGVLTTVQRFISSLRGFGPDGSVK
jgi:archaetidylinositol phosphate synthase